MTEVQGDRAEWSKNSIYVESSPKGNQKMTLKERWVKFIKGKLWEFFFLMGEIQPQ